MNLSDEYKRQFQWRPWAAIFDTLPRLEGQTVFDFGCGVGDLAAEFVTRGSRVIGVDRNEELLREARSRKLPNATFRTGDLRAVPDLGEWADGVWCSFTAAYFPELPETLVEWAKHLNPGGWIALTEIDDLFGHEPLSPQAKTLLDSYATAALEAKRYDFHMGRKLQNHLEQAGFKVLKNMTLEDQEFSFDGPARPEVVDAWRTRFDRMKLLEDFCKPNFAHVREAFLECLIRKDHSSAGKVFCSLAIKEDAQADTDRPPIL